jgi:hypothetical protein
LTGSRARKGRCYSIDRETRFDEPEQVEDGQRKQCSDHLQRVGIRRRLNLGGTRRDRTYDEINEREMAEDLGGSSEVRSVEKEEEKGCKIGLIIYGPARRCLRRERSSTFSEPSLTSHDSDARRKVEDLARFSR